MKRIVVVNSEDTRRKCKRVFIHRPAPPPQVQRAYYYPRLCNLSASSLRFHLCFRDVSATDTLGYDDWDIVKHYLVGKKVGAARAAIFLVAASSEVSGRASLHSFHQAMLQRLATQSSSHAPAEKNMFQVLPSGEHGHLGQTLWVIFEEVPSGWWPEFDSYSHNFIKKLPEIWWDLGAQKSIWPGMA